MYAALGFTALVLIRLVFPFLVLILVGTLVNKRDIQLY